MDIFQLLTMLILLLLLLASIDSRPSEIRVGVLLPITGPNSNRAKSHKNGILLGAEHVNRSGGINGKPLKLLVKDNTDDHVRTAIEARNLIYEDQIQTLLGGLTPENTRIMQQFCEKAEIPFLTALCTHFEITSNNSKYTFRSISDDKKQFEAICEYTSKRFSARKPALIYDTQIYDLASAQKFIEAALKNGQQVVAAVTYRPGTINFRQQLNIIRASNPDSLFIIAPPYESALILRQAREQKFAKPICGVNPLSSSLFIKLAGIYSESTVCTLPFNPRSGGQRADYFLSEYMERFGLPADSDAALGYEAIMLTALALKAGDMDKKRVRDYFATMHGWESVTGSGGFDSNGNQVRPAEIAIIKERQKIPVNLEELF